LTLFGSGGGSTGNSSSSTGSSGTNFLSATFSNPLYMGRGSQSASNQSAAASTINTTIQQSVGGFGQPSLGTVTTTSSTGGRGGLGGTASTSSTAARFTPMPSTMSRLTYATVVDFPTTPFNGTALQAQLQGIIDQSSALRNPRSIQISMDGRTVILRGRVTDEKERRLAENLIRLTPGVRQVQNELEAPPVVGQN